MYAVFLALALAVGFQGRVAADDHKHHERKAPRPRTASQSPPSPTPAPTDNPGDAPVSESLVPSDAGSLYIEQCAACHFAYQPELLPSGSWRKILENLDDHFGEALPLEPETADEILVYLESGAADHSSTKRARKIMDSLGGNIPLRVTEVPYLRHKHRKITNDVLQRPSIGSLSNCIACHPGAVKGEYDDHSASIPR